MESQQSFVLSKNVQRKNFSGFKVVWELSSYESTRMCFACCEKRSLWTFKTQEYGQRRRMAGARKKYGVITYGSLNKVFDNDDLQLNLELLATGTM